MAKVAMAKVYHDIAQRAVHLHGALGTSRDTPLAKLWMGVPILAVADGPTEVHKVQVAKALLKQAKPAPGLFPTEHIPTKREAALARYGKILQELEE
jgi:acyl-CoA dehydrogenase